MSKYKDDETKSGNTLGQFIRQSMDPIEEEAIKSIKSIYENLIVQQKYSEKAVNGKNKTIRDNNALKAVLQSWKILKELKPWNEVIKAKENGVDIDSAPIKSSKLEIVAGTDHKFGQYIIDKEIHDKR